MGTFLVHGAMSEDPVDPEDPRSTLFKRRKRVHLRPMKPADVALLRLAAQQLIEPPEATPAQVVARLGAVQSQDWFGGGWGLGVDIPELAAIAVLLVAVAGRIAGGQVPPAPPVDDPEIPGFPDRGMDWHILRASIRLVSATMHIKHLFLAILSISFFWAMGAVLAAQFPPLVKNTLYADQSVATLFLAVFSVGVAVGSVAINRMLRGEVSARYAPSSALLMGVFVLLLYLLCRNWPASPELVGIGEFLEHPLGWAVVLDLFGVAVSGGMFVVPLYAFLTTTVPKSETARTVAANNIVNAGAMVVATLMLTGLVLLGVSVAESLFLVAVASVVAAWLGWKLHQACD